MSDLIRYGQTQPLAPYSVSRVVGPVGVEEVAAAEAIPFNLQRTVYSLNSQAYWTQRPGIALPGTPVVVEAIPYTSPLPIAATHKDRRLVPQYTLKESPVGLLDTAQLEVPPPLSPEYMEAATHKDRRLVPQQRIPYESVPGLLDTALLEIPSKTAEVVETAVTHQRLPWLRVKPTQADQSSAAVVEAVPYRTPDQILPAKSWFDYQRKLLPVPVAVPFTRTNLHGSISNTTGAFGTGAYTTTSFTPPDASLLVVGVAAQRSNAGGDIAPNLTIADSVGLTWTLRKSQGDGIDFGTGTAVWTAPVTTGVSMTVTIDCGADTIAWYMVSVVAYTGYDTTTPVGATGSVAKTAGFATPEPAVITLDAATATTSEVFGTIAASKTTPHDIIHGAGYTELYDFANTEWGDGESQVRVSSTSTTYVWDDVRNTASLFDYSASAVEIRSAGVAVEAIPYIAQRTVPWRDWVQQVWLQRQARVDQGTVANPFDVLLHGPDWPKVTAVTHQRLPWVRYEPTQYDQSSQPAGTPFDPTLAGYGWIAELMPATHWSRRLVPTQRPGIQNPDEIMIVGTGATGGWWGTDDSAHYFAQWLPTQLDPNFLTPPVDADPLILQDSSDRERQWFVRPWNGQQVRWLYDQSVPAGALDVTLNGGYGPEWRRWYRSPVAPVQRDRESDPNLLLTALLEDVLLGGWDDTARHRAWVPRPWFGLQRTAEIDQSTAPAPEFDPVLSGYGPRWMWYRPPVAPVQRDRESDPRLLLTALLEDALLGGWDDILRHRTWHTDRRLVPQQRSYPDRLQPIGDPLLIAGAEWRYRLIPATHAPRWVLRQWWQQKFFQGADPLLFQGTIIGGILPGASITGAGTIGGSLTGFSRDGNMTGEVR